MTEKNQTFRIIPEFAIKISAAPRNSFTPAVSKDKKFTRRATKPIAKSGGIILLTIASLLAFSCKLQAGTFTPKAAEDLYMFSFTKLELWNYLRSGLNYLESPSPLIPPESIPPTYIHPDSKGFGAYGFSPEAYEDVQRLYPFFRQYSWQDITHSFKLYDLASQAFADWLLKNLKNYLPENASKQQIFQILHQAWNLGLSGFKKGRKVIDSRTKRASEFTAFNSFASRGVFSRCK